MKKINLMTLKEYFQRIMDREGRYSVIYLIKTTKKQPVRITKNKNCIEVVEVKIDEYCDFTPYMAEKILRFCERQIDVDDVIIVYDVEKSLAENIAEAIENAYGIAEHETPFENIIFRFIRLKSYEINNSLIKHLPPMEYCKMIIKLSSPTVSLRRLTLGPGAPLYEMFQSIIFILLLLIRSTLLKCSRFFRTHF